MTEFSSRVPVLPLRLANSEVRVKWRLTCVCVCVCVGGGGACEYACASLSA